MSCVLCVKGLISKLPPRSRQPFRRLDEPSLRAYLGLGNKNKQCNAGEHVKSIYSCPLREGSLQPPSNAKKASKGHLWIEAPQLPNSIGLGSPAPNFRVPRRAPGFGFHSTACDPSGPLRGHASGTATWPQVEAAF